MPPDDAATIRDFLANRDIPCPGCGYNLRGLPDPICPECRQPIRLAVELTEARMGSLFASVGSLFAGTGAAAALLVTVLVISMAFGRGFPRRTDEQLILLWLPLATLLTCGFLAMRLSRRSGRVWFRSLPDSKRRMVIAGSIAMPIVWFLVFLVTMMSRF